MNCRGALDLISAYGDDLSEDEDEVVPGSKVSTKRMHKSDSDDDDLNSAKHNKLPIPQQLISKKITDVLNDNAHNNGRVRSFPHERGNWATFVYIPFDSNYLLEELKSALKSHVNTIDLNDIDDCHISLTKTVILKYHWIDSFKLTVSEAIKSCRRFIVMFDSLKIYCNEEQTRTFIGLQIRSGYDSLLNLTTILDKCLLEYKLETFYKSPSFHMSFLWCLGDKVQELNAILPQLNEIFSNIFKNSDASCWFINVDTIYCKSGNKSFLFGF